MPFTTTQLQALKDALASGELTVTYDGKTVTYRSIEELKKAIAFVEAELQTDGLLPTRTRVSYASFSKD
ncbi:MAG: phage head-tail joining protein [Steroidobacteraceae bacterium]